MSAIRRRTSKRHDAMSAAGVALRAIRDSADAFPPLKSAVAAAIIVCEMSQKVKSNRKECLRLAHRTAQMVDEIYRQTKDYDDDLPEVQESMARIEQISRDIIVFMQHLEGENVLQRYARQDRNRRRIQDLEKLLGEATTIFGLNLQLSIRRMHIESSQSLISLNEVVRVQHGELLDVSRMTDTERKLLKAILANTESMSIRQRSSLHPGDQAESDCIHTEPLIKEDPSFFFAPGF